MKIQLTLKYWSYGLNYRSLPGGLVLDLEREPDPEDLIRHLCEHSHISFEALRAHPGGVRPNRAPQYVQPAKDNGARLQLCPPDIAAELRAVLIEAPDTRFKYSLTCRRILEAMNSAYRDSPRTRKKYPVNWAYMNPEDMTAEGIEDNACISRILMGMPENRGMAGSDAPE